MGTAWTPSIGMRFAGNPSGMSAGTLSWLSAAVLVVDGLLLAWPSHHDGRARISGPPEPAPGASVQPQAWADPWP